MNKNFKGDTRNRLKGQALVALLVFVILAVTYTTAATIIMAVNSLSGSYFEQGIITSNLSESGIENAMLILLRDSGYIGETLSFDEGSSTIEVVGSGGINTIVSQATYRNFLRKFLAGSVYSDNILTVNSWREEF